MMAYYHYSKEKFGLDKEFYKLADHLNNRSLCGKPIGLWISVGTAWEDWCKDQDFELEGLKYRYRVKFKKKANICYLRSSQDIFDFTAKYQPKKFDRLIKRNSLKEKEKCAEILKDLRNATPEDLLNDFLFPWEKVKADYQGLIISPYQWDCRLDSFTMWYYGWDCASGCIWDLDAIDEFKLEETND